MPYSNNNGGPWGNGGRKGGGRGPWGSGGDDGDRPEGRNDGNRPGGPQKPVADVEQLVRKGQEQLRVLMGGRPRGGSGGPPGGGGGGGEGIGRGGIVLTGIALVAAWLFMSVYTVRPEEQSVELFFGEFSSIGNSGLNFAPWPVITYTKLGVTEQRVEELGRASTSNPESGLMLTGDENIVDIQFEVAWNIADAEQFLFNLANPEETIRAVSESAMREVVGRSELAPILNRDRGLIEAEVQSLIQSTLDSYRSGVRVLRLTLDRVDPPQEVIDSFRAVQQAAQERNTFQNQADAYSNQRLAAARGESAEILQQAEAYRAQTVNEATGEASRFVAIYDEYAKAPDVVRKRMYLETLERVMTNIDKVIVDPAIGGEGGQGVVPYLPLNELRSRTIQGAGQ
jgi:membrane protease subunit HflK